MATLPPQTFYVQEIGIYPEAQGHGYGTRMMECARQTALEYGCYQMALDVEITNIRAIAAWTKFGFQPIHRFGDYHRMTYPLA